MHDPSMTLPDELRLNLLDGVLRHFIRGRNLVGELLLILGSNQHLVHLTVPLALLLVFLPAASVRGKRRRRFAACKKGRDEMGKLS